MMVVGASMEPSLRDGDVLLVDTSGQPPATGDIVVFRRPIGLLVKVIIGTTGGRLRVAGTGLSKTPEQLGPVHPDEVVGIARRIVAPPARWRRLDGLRVAA
ncbi:signal peptidase I [Actinoplanes octamycinicus]|uniref:Signal peptidase I n=2 Tax=Actinoplanes octamycinicus TaxID=135948 RepID=A0A7W7H0U2_9ACTN|nr:signal peptidase I [Actinoplanes octamycinicus]